VPRAELHGPVSAYVAMLEWNAGVKQCVGMQALGWIAEEDGKEMERKRLQTDTYVYGALHPATHGRGHIRDRGMLEQMRFLQ